jgi:tRNA U34 5-methylaminomethyl-2-thiouridine-forming methyltransferase MnmC
MIKRNIVTSGDGSKTFKLEDFDESYHSMFGALAESRHIYIGCGLKYLMEKTPLRGKIRILEVGLGTGLNCMLTALELRNHPEIEIDYTAVEKYPVTNEEVIALDHSSLFSDEKEEAKVLSVKIHNSPWEIKTSVLPNFSLLKIEDDFVHFVNNSCNPDISEYKFDLIYFDAFAPEIQPELWSEDIFKKIIGVTETEGILVTYSSKGIVKRALREAGFTVSRLKGPKGKRHIIRAEKTLL